MNENQTIAIVGATGMLGSHVTRVLASEGFSIIVVARDPEKAEKLLSGVNAEFRHGDLRDPDSLRQAFEGAGLLYMNLSTGPFERGAKFKTEIDGVSNAINAAADAGIRRIGYLSSLVKDYTASDWWVFDYKREAVRLLLAGPVPATIFYPSNFFENLTELQMRGKRIMLAGDQITKSWWVGTLDYGKQVAAAFRQNHDENREYPVQGPESFSFEEAAREFIKHYKPASLKISKAPIWVFRLIKPFSKTVDFQYNIVNAINNYDEKFTSEKTWEELGKPQQTLKDFACTFS
jgi:uncharacterized protein YbjT (DUF2867 family)